MKPYYTCSSGDIYLGDCRDILPQIKGAQDTITVTSPPYNMNLRVRNGKHCSRQIVKELSTKYIDYSDNLSMSDYEDLNTQVITECLRLSSLVFYNIQFLTGNKQALYKVMGKYSENIKEFIVWDKINAEPAIASGVMNSRFEALLVMADEKEAITRQFKHKGFSRGTCSNVWQIKKGKKTTKDHAAVFPEKLVQDIITNFIPENSTLLDPFAGTGTVALAACKSGNRFIAIERSERYCEVIASRLEELSCRK